MAELYNAKELRKNLVVNVKKRQPYKENEDKRFENIESFNSLSRSGLKSGSKERRLFLFETLNNEKIGIQYPGKESVRSKNLYENDFRPFLIKSNGDLMDDWDFKKIWDILDNVGKGMKDNIEIIASLFLRIAYMIGYKNIDDSFNYEDIDMDSGASSNKGTLDFSFNSIDLDDKSWNSINNTFHKFEEVSEGISVQGFIYYNELLCQNEDCKYKFLREQNWKANYGRINTALTHLSIIGYEIENISMSELINKFQQGNGVGPISQGKVDYACLDLVNFVD